MHFDHIVQPSLHPVTDTTGNFHLNGRNKRAASFSCPVIGILNDWLAVMQNQVTKEARRSIGHRFITYLKEYCTSCALAGFPYIANHNLHPTERIFWLTCIIASVFGVYYLIAEYQRDYSTRAVSIVYEGLSPFTQLTFPAVSVCEVDLKYNVSKALEEYVRNAGVGDSNPYNYDVETHINFILFPFLYTFGTLKSNCIQYENCAECAKCPKTDYRGIATRFGFNCSDLFIRCSLSDSEFDCCNYFLPMTTPYGRCFLLNSLHNNQRSSKHWLPAILDRSSRPIMEMHLTRAVRVTVLHEEDITNIPLPAVDVTVPQGAHKSLQFHKETMVNDPDMKDIPFNARDCYFPDELRPNSIYKAYSFSSCISDCTRMIQMELCNCSAYNMSPQRNSKYPDCDYEGYLCLERHSMIQPNAKRLLSYQSEAVRCKCLPSCVEGDIKSIFQEQISAMRGRRDTNVTLVMPIWPTDQYRRQILRSKLDVVVSIGGILGLFLGASILSAIEFFYYFTVRAANTALMVRKDISLHA